VRVLVAHNRYRTPGGEERHVDLLVRSLRDLGHDVQLHQPTSDDVGDRFRDRARIGVTLTYRPKGGRGISSAIERWHPEVVHFHNLFPLLTPAALRAAQRSGAKVVVTAHNFRFFCPSGLLLRNGVVHEDCIEGSSLLCGLRNARGSWIESASYGIAIEIQRRLRLLSRWTDAFIALSRFSARLLMRSGVLGRLPVVIPNATTVRAQTSSTREFALFAGRLSAEKGVQTLLESCRLAPEVPVVVAGDGPSARDVRRTAPAHVRFVGQISRTELDQLRAASAFAVVPSTCYESAPYAVLETMAAARPVVASAIGGIPEIVGDGADGLLVPPGDARALATAMTLLWRDAALCRRLGARAAATIASRFSLAQQARSTVELYESLVKRHA
jgi:glycosyltransferase involved in cell wall biosynthesis